MSEVEKALLESALRGIAHSLHANLGARLMVFESLVLFGGKVDAS